MNKSIRTPLHLLMVLLVFVIAFGLRTYAANNLTIDYDEDDYLRAGQEFAHLIRTANWRGFLDMNYRPEHPQLAKIMFGLSILHLPEEPLVPDVPITANPAKSLPPDLLKAARGMSVTWGSLTAALLALINPLGGLLLAVHTFTIKYTSQVMLDGFASLMSTLTALAYYFSKRKQGKAKNALLVLSAAFLGMSASSKYLHSAVGFAILIDWFLVARQSGEVKKYFRNALLWGLLAIAVFFVFNPFYWPDPLGRIKTTLEAVAGTTTNPNVVNANLPTWQQLVFLGSSVPESWNAEGILFRLDGIIFVFALFGLWNTWKKDRFIAIWFFVGIFLLLIWRTKWPQYILVATAPLSVAAAEGVKATGADIADWWRNRHRRRAEALKPSRKETLRALPWLVPGLLFFIVLTLLPILYQFAMSLTTLGGASLRDGLQGGIMREVVGGITGQIKALSQIPNVQQFKVHYVALLGYLDTIDFLRSIGATFFGYFWTITSVSTQAVLGIAAGLLLWRSKDRTRKIWQTIFILPWAIPEAIGAVLWLNIFAPFNGWLALAVKKYGPGIPFGNLMGWEKHPDSTLIVLLIAALWYGFPFIMLATSAGLKMLPKEVYDAAAIDGADAWQTFRYITLPLLQPLVLPALLVRAIFAFNQFYLFQVFVPYYDNAGMLTLSSLSYYILFKRSEFAFSAIINIIAVILLSVFVLLLNRWSKATEGVTYA
jgi:ABC-type sugar transport system permease subunit